MEGFQYLAEHFFTHKDYLLPADQIPGTLFTPLHFAFSITVFIIVLVCASYVSKREHLIKPVFIGVWAFLAVFEIVIIAWESLTGKNPGLDLSCNLSLYPCSIFLYAMPFAIWGKGAVRKMACGYICTLGFIGGAVNFLYPAIRLSSYSCISFPGFHTFSYHGLMLFTCLVMLRSKYHCYSNINHWWEMFYACIPTLLISVPANLVNYSAINADYMFFRGKFPLFASIFSGISEIQTTLIVYLVYILMPAIFYIPPYLSEKKRKREESVISAV